MHNPFETIDARLSNIEGLLLDIKHGPVVEKPINEWMNIDDLRQYLPFHPAKQTVYAMVSKEEIPFHKKGKCLYFNKSEIDIWLMGPRSEFDVQEQVDAILSAPRKFRKREGKANPVRDSKAWDLSIPKNK